MNALFHIYYKQHTWIIEPACHKGVKRVIIWPCYRDEDGNLKHGKGGLRLPTEEAEAFAEAILAAAAQLR